MEQGAAQALVDLGPGLVGGQVGAVEEVRVLPALAVVDREGGPAQVVALGDGRTADAGLLHVGLVGAHPHHHLVAQLRPGPQEEVVGQPAQAAGRKAVVEISLHVGEEPVAHVDQAVIPRPHGIVDRAGQGADEEVGGEGGQDQHHRQQGRGGEHAVQSQVWAEGHGPAAPIGEEGLLVQAQMQHQGQGDGGDQIVPIVVAVVDDSPDQPEQGQGGDQPALGGVEQFHGQGGGHPDHEQGQGQEDQVILGGPAAAHAINPEGDAKPKALQGRHHLPAQIGPGRGKRV